MRKLAILRSHPIDKLLRRDNRRVARLTTLITLAAGLMVGVVLTPQALAATSINSTSQSCGVASTRNPMLACQSTSVPEPGKILGTRGYAVLAINDLGMHCGDLDTRVASILPPFQAAKAQVVKKGATPILLDDLDTILYYSAASSPKDPVLNRVNPPEFDLRGGVYKTNFWESLKAGAYDAFYPLDVSAIGSTAPDVGLPVPDSAQLPQIALSQQVMPGRSGPYTVNLPKKFARFDTDLQFFSNFPFGYGVTGVNWFAADGIPFSTFDDSGRLNSYPLVRVQARAAPGNRLGVQAGVALGTVDTVLPISGEADCWGCHGAPAEASNTRIATQLATKLGGNAKVASSIDDPREGKVPFAVSREYASDLNVLRLHDLNEGGRYVGADGKATRCIDPSNPTDANCLVNRAPVVCQTCHYTPALDLAQVGPLGGSPAYPDDSMPAIANGRAQRINKTMSRVMHDYHGAKVASLMTPMPPPIDAAGQPRNLADKDRVLAATCYSCHPGKNTKCLRGAMSAGGVVCQDCHGDVRQVGNDFSERMAPGRPFPVSARLVKRVPWANEPGCQSCHTGDALNKRHPAGALVAPDGIRLLQAWKKITLADNTSLAVPYQSPNSRFAENRVTLAGGKTTGALYRLSTGHGGVMCEGCHGSTHAEWPVTPDRGNFIANDNQTALQLQGHTGKVLECDTCHTGPMTTTLEGPHGLHPVGNKGLSASWTSNHGELLGDNPSLQKLRASCGTCHGPNGAGSVLAEVAINRPNLKCEEGKLCPSQSGAITLQKGTLVSCNLCHSNPFH